MYQTHPDEKKYKKREKIIIITPEKVIRIA